MSPAAAALCIVLGVASPAGPAVAAAPSAQAVRDAATAELASGYQTALPDEATVEAAARKKAGLRRRVDAPPAPAPSPLADVAGAMVWVLAGVGALLVLAWLLRDLLGLGTRPVRAAVDARPDDATVRAVVAAPLRDAEALAADGKFGEAIHVLLLRTLAALIERGRRRVPPSLTSREIIAAAELPADADAALRGLVSAVEVSHFGGQEPAAAEWQLCLDHFHRFARAFGGSRGPEAAP
jgi:hypothetical protein